MPYPALLPLALAATAFSRDQFIHPEAPQAAFAGRSNVGKSSLLNALAGRKNLARTSARPGRTRSINYYRLGGDLCFLADLPGYGYARCSLAERARWAHLLDFYFRHTPGLRCLFLLLDARLDPQDNDRGMVSFASSLGLPLIPVLTKTDSCSRKRLQRTELAWQSALAGKSLLNVSARTGTGLAPLQSNIVSLLRGE
ncbi:MAG: ribosome biogenesis GTP-binding protein YihA/YsxC [Desulfovibrio sp.]|jgi:GTP-binding protein|nr:ribosome biogenesis GTP-binding protein YihA/YsxC [Desulfovibrio sp.]